MSVDKALVHTDDGTDPTQIGADETEAVFPAQFFRYRGDGDDVGKENAHFGLDLVAELHVGDIVMMQKG